jgi:hypothetical protein
MEGRVMKRVLLVIASLCMFCWAGWHAWMSLPQNKFAELARIASQPPETLATLDASPMIATYGLDQAYAIADPLYVYTEGDQQTQDYLRKGLSKYRKKLEVDRILKSDKQISEDEIHYRTLFIYGSPENNALLKRFRDQLPIVIQSDGIVVGDRKCMGRDVGVIFVCPNPLDSVNSFVVYGAVSPEAVKKMNAIYHKQTDYVVFNDATRSLGTTADDFLLLGSFNKADQAHWRVDDALQLLPPRFVRKRTPGVVVAWAGR